MPVFWKLRDKFTMGPGRHTEGAVATLSTGSGDFANSICILSSGIHEKEKVLPSFYSGEKKGSALQNSLISSHIITEGGEGGLNQSRGACSHQRASPQSSALGLLGLPCTPK